MIYEYMGTSAMSVEGKKVRKPGDRIETEKKIKHPLFKLVNQNKGVKSVKYARKGE